MIPPRSLARPVRGESSPTALTNPRLVLHFLLLFFSGRVDCHQQRIIDYLIEENRVLRAQFGRRRLRLSDNLRRRLTVKGKILARKATLRRWRCPQNSIQSSRTTTAHRFRRSR